jgi:hypothetical protein
MPGRHPTPSALNGFLVSASILNAAADQIRETRKVMVQFSNTAQDSLQNMLTNGIQGIPIADIQSAINLDLSWVRVAEDFPGGC